MKSMKRELQRLRKVKRKSHHPLIHRIHRKYKISRRTLFYVKEYGPHSNVSKTIIRESIKILLFASIISSIGGLAMENIKAVLVSLTPLIILLPALNDMIGDYGMIISSKFSAMLHEGKIKGRWWKNSGIKKIFAQIFLISIITASISSLIAVAISGFSFSYKIFLVSIIDTAILVSILFLIAVFAGLYFFRKGEDPSNFLIPITTSVADFGNMIILSVLVILFF